MYSRVFPPYALFDYWGIQHNGTIDECEKELRRFWSDVSQQEWSPEPSYITDGENLRAYRLLNRWSIRYVSKILGMRRSRVKKAEHGDFSKTNCYDMYRFVHLYGDLQWHIPDCNYYLLRTLISEKVSDMQTFNLINNNCDVLSRLLEIPEYEDIPSKQFFQLMTSKPSIAETTGTNFCWARKKEKLSIYWVSKLSGIAINDILKLERGEGADIMLSALARLAEAVGEPCPIKLMFKDYMYGKMGGDNSSAKSDYATLIKSNRNLKKALKQRGIPLHKRTCDNGSEETGAKSS